MRKTQKSVISTIYKQGVNNVDSAHENAIYLIDGGYLLHKVKWLTNSTYEELCEEYEEYVITKYCGNSVIVLDGYADLANSTKSHEHLLRCVTSREIQHENNHHTGSLL